MARGFLNGESIVDIEAERDELLATRTADHARIAQLTSRVLAMRRVLTRCEGFIAGFEDDEEQEGVVELLADIRKLMERVNAQIL